MQQFLASLLLLGHAALVGGAAASISGSSAGDFAVLGRICLDKTKPGKEVWITINIKSSANYAQQINMYDDEQGTYFEGLHDAGTCDGKVKLANHIEGPFQGDFTQMVRVTEHYKRKWFFTLSSCGGNGPVSATSYTITSDNAVDCKDLGPDGMDGYQISTVVLAIIVFLVVIVPVVLMTKRMCCKMSRERSKSGGAIIEL